MEVKSHPFTLPFVKKELVAKDTFAFYFDRSKENWEFHPGQYIRMILPQDNPDDRGTMRYFTISSSPLDKTYLRITTKVMQSTFKYTLDSLQPGQEVSFFGPSGAFYLQEQEKSHVLLAGGIGMTPFVSMIEYVGLKNLDLDITFMVSFSTKEELVYFEELSKIASLHKNIKVIYSVSHSDENWKGETGRITEDLIKKYVPDISKPLYYIVGPPPMVEATVDLVGNMGIAEDRILQEHFSGY